MGNGGQHPTTAGDVCRGAPWVMGRQTRQFEVEYNKGYSGRRRLVRTNAPKQLGLRLSKQESMVCYLEGDDNRIVSLWLVLVSNVRDRQFSVGKWHKNLVGCMVGWGTSPPSFQNSQIGSGGTWLRCGIATDPSTDKTWTPQKPSSHKHEPSQNQQIFQTIPTHPESGVLAHHVQAECAINMCRNRDIVCLPPGTIIGLPAYFSVCWTSLCKPL